MYLVVLLVLLTVVSSVRTFESDAITSRKKSFIGEHLLPRENGSLGGDNQSCSYPSVTKYIIQSSNCEARILRCYCLTPTNTSVISPNKVQFAVGHCLQGCFITNKYMEYYTVSIKNSWNSTLCSSYNREGTLCGKCKRDFGPPVYSFSLCCVKCHNARFWKHLLLYISIAYGPLTLFLGVIMIFSVSVNSAPLHGWIFVCQIIGSSFYMRVLTRMAEIHHTDQYSYRILGTFYGVWNLDFFRTLYMPFCLHSSLTTLQVMSMDYIIALYPLVIIVVVYVLVDLYSRNCRPVVIMCRPFHCCFTRFRHQLIIRTSLVDTFGTFFSLSYVKMFSTIVDLMSPTMVWKEDGTTSFHSYADGTQVFLKNGHLPFAVLSIGALVVFNLLPLLLLLLYSFPKTQVCIRCFPRLLQNALFPFMDNILSCYKDGTNGASNCRYFAVVYHIARMLLWSSIMWTESVLFYSVAAVVVIASGMLVTLIRPYKSAVYNALDTFLLLSLALTLVGNSAFFEAYIDDPQNKNVGIIMVLFPLIVSFFYIFIYMGYEVWAVRKVPQALTMKLLSLFSRKVRAREGVSGISESSALIEYM